MKIVLSFDVPSKEYVDYERLLSRIRRLAVDALIDEKNDVLRETDKKERIDLKCDYCGTSYQKPIGKATKYCSKYCQYKAQSSGLHEIPSNGRLGFRYDLPNNYFFKSSLEADYARWCEATKKPYIYEHKTFTVEYDGRDKQYTPDFYHPDEDRYV